MAETATTNQTPETKPTENNNASESQISELKNLIAAKEKEAAELKKANEANSALLEVLKKKGFLGDDGKPTDKDDKYEMIRKQAEETQKKNEELLAKAKEQENKLAILERNDKIRDWVKHNSKEGKIYSPSLIIGLMKDTIPNDLAKAVKELEKEFPEIVTVEKNVGPKPDGTTPTNKEGNQGHASVTKAVEELKKTQIGFREGLSKLIEKGRA